MITLDLTNALAEKKDIFQDSFLSWARCHFRDYPWRHQRQNPYAILVAELLLKRTTATAAANTYPTFFNKYPTLLHLATATEDELVQDLRPVGLYRQRAKAIYQMMRYLMENENGSLPNSLGRLLQVPGLGSYSARAILSFGFGFPVAVVDANVERVIERVFQKAIPKKRPHFLLQEIVDYMLPKETHRQFNFGLLDFGALVCRYVIPRCDDCVLNRICDFYATAESRDVAVTPIPRLRQVRLAKGLALAQLAVKAGVSKLTIIRIEAGQTVPQPRTVQKLAVALDVTPEEIV